MSVLTYSCPVYQLMAGTHVCVNLFMPSVLAGDGETCLC